MPPDGHTQSFGFDTLGVRVPAILISPWVDPGVLPTQFDHTSLLQYATRKFGLGPLGNRTAQANSFGDALLHRTTPRTDCPAGLPIPDAVANSMDVALNGLQASLSGFTHNLEVNQTQADDATVALHSRQMAGSFADQTQAVSERVLHFLKGV